MAIAGGNPVCFCISVLAPSEWRSWRTYRFSWGFPHARNVSDEWVFSFQCSCRNKPYTYLPHGFGPKTKHPFWKKWKKFFEERKKPADYSQRASLHPNIHFSTLKRAKNKRSTTMQSQTSCKHLWYAIGICTFPDPSMERKWRELESLLESLLLFLPKMRYI